MPPVIARRVQSMGFTPVAILATHAHFDHVEGVAGLKKLMPVPFRLHEEELSLLQGMRAQGLFFGVNVEPAPNPDSYLMAVAVAASASEPVFVPASEAEIPGEAWVLGVVVEGEAKAYSLNLLNRHEVVNDRTGNTAFAAVW